MRKIPKKYENPFDNLLIDCANTWCPFFKRLNFTPNTLTTISLIFGVLSAYVIYNDKYKLGAFFYLLSYFFDCCDGHYARKYNMVTEFGDKYDHVKDAVVFISIYYILSIKYKVSNNIRNGLAIITFLSFIHLGCQEKLYNKNESGMISHCKKLCINTKFINFTKYFGSGTLIIITLIIIIYSGCKLKKKKR